jgi:hypothetical protein
MNNSKSQDSHKWLHVHRYANTGSRLSVVNHADELFCSSSLKPRYTLGLYYAPAFKNLSATFRAVLLFEGNEHRKSTPDILECHPAETETNEDLQGDLSCRRSSKRTKRPNNAL